MRTVKISLVIASSAVFLASCTSMGSVNSPGYYSNNAGTTYQRPKSTNTYYSVASYNNGYNNSGYYGASWANSDGLYSSNYSNNGYYNNGYYNNRYYGVGVNYNRWNGSRFHNVRYNNSMRTLHGSGYHAVRTHGHR